MTSLPPDALSKAFGFLDVRDVSPVSRVSKEWGSALRTTEREDNSGETAPFCPFWLNLIRKHHPIVEELTNMLPADVDDGSPTTYEVRDDMGSFVPAPSRDWKRQFERSHKLIRLPTPGAQPNPIPKPLSSYFLQVDIRLYEDNNRRQTVGVVSNLIKNVAFNSDNMIGFSLGAGDIRKLQTYDFAASEVRVHLVDKASGKQAVLCGGQRVDFNKDVHWHLFDYVTLSHSLSTCYIDCGLHVTTQHCVCHCAASTNNHRDLDWRCDFFTPSDCSCCRCEDKWACFWRLDCKVSILHCPNETTGDDHADHLSKEAQLQLFERLHFV